MARLLHDRRGADVRELGSRLRLVYGDLWRPLRPAGRDQSRERSSGGGRPALGCSDASSIQTPGLVRWLRLKGRRESLGRVVDRPVALANALAASEGLPVIEVCPGGRIGTARSSSLSDPKALVLSCEPADPQDSDGTMLYWALVATGSQAALRELASAAVAGGDAPETRNLLREFIARKVLPAHRDWFCQAVLFPEHGDRIVRLRWTRAATAHRQDDEPMSARLDRISYSMGTRDRASRGSAVGCGERNRPAVV